MRLAFAVFCITAILFGQAAQPKLGKIEGKVAHSVSGAPVPCVSLTLMPTFQPGGAGVLGGVVSVAPTGPPQPAGVVSSGADGSFSFTNIAAGSYQLRAERNGFLNTAYGAATESSPPTILRLTEGQEITGLTFKLAPQSVLVVKVLDENGEPVNRATVQVLRTRFIGGQRTLLPMSSGQTNDLGEFRGSAGAGTYYLTALPAPTNGSGAVPPRRAGQTADEITVTTYYPGAIDRNNASPVTLGVGQEVPLTINIQKGHAYRIRGTLPADMARNQLMLMPRSREPFAPIGGIRGLTAVTADGSFEFAGVVPGSYTLMMMSRAGNNPMANPIGRAMIEVGNRDVEGVTFVPVESVTLKGRIIIEGNTGVEGKAGSDKPDFTSMRVLPSMLDNLPNLTTGTPPTAAADGSFTIEGITQARYQLRVIGNLQGAYLKSIRYGQQDVTKTGIDLNGVASPPPVEIVYSRKPASVDITVIRASPERSPGVVLLVPDAPSPLPNDPGYIPLQVNETGSASNKVLTPGKYHVYALEIFNPIEGIDGEVLKRLESKSERITVAEGETATVSVKQLLPADLETR